MTNQKSLESSLSGLIKKNQTAFYQLNGEQIEIKYPAYFIKDDDEFAIIFIYSDRAWKRDGTGRIAENGYQYKKDWIIQHIKSKTLPFKGTSFTLSQAKKYCKLVNEAYDWKDINNPDLIEENSIHEKHFFCPLPKHCISALATILIYFIKMGFTKNSQNQSGVVANHYLHNTACDYIAKHPINKDFIKNHEIFSQQIKLAAQ